MTTKKYRFVVRDKNLTDSCRVYRLGGSLKIFELGKKYEHLETDRHPVLVEMSWASKKRLIEFTSLCKPKEWNLTKFPEGETIYWGMMASLEHIEIDLLEAKRENSCLPKPSYILGLLRTDFNNNGWKLLINGELR